MKILRKLAVLAVSLGIVSFVLPANAYRVNTHKDWEITNKAKYALADLSGIKTNNDTVAKIDTAKTAKAITKFQIHAPQAVVWDVLTDFQKYPQVFKRVKKCDIVKRDGDLVYVESDLRAQMFVKQEKNRTINDLKGKPNILDWVLVDGSFASARGRWEICPTKSGKDCNVIYTLIVDPGSIMPSYVTSLVLKFVQKEIISAVKHRAEDMALQKSVNQSAQNIMDFQQL
jgi:ribosome-associated toxin RatA of RatAB toxin-antitoxin module